MNTEQIKRLLEMDSCTRDVLVGVYPRDRLPLSITKYPSAYVCNTDPHTEDGEHWLVIYVDDCGRGEFFDSYGLPPLHKRFLKFLNVNCSSWTFNDKQLQGLNSRVCGHYCVFYLLHRCRGVSMNTIVKMFGNSMQDNDVLVHDAIVGE